MGGGLASFVPPAVAQAASTDITVTGTVVDQSTNQPVPNAWVQVVTYDDQNGEWNGNGVCNAGTTVDASDPADASGSADGNGVYTCVIPADEAWSISAGYTPGYAQGWLGNQGDPNDAQDAQAPLLPGTTTPLSAITLQPLNTAQVCVTDTATPSTPLSDISLMLWGWQDGSWSPWWDNQYTDDTGCATLTLPAGFSYFTVEAQSDGTYASTYLGDTITQPTGINGSGVQKQVSPVSYTTADWGTIQMSTLIPVTAKVVDQNNQPIPNVCVYAQVLDSSSNDWSNNGVDSIWGCQVQTDSYGDVTVGVPANTTYTLYASQNGYTTTWLGNTSTQPTADSTTGTKASTVTDVTSTPIQMTAMTTITGTLVDTDGNPITMNGNNWPSVNITAWDSQGNSVWNSDDSCYVNYDATYYCQVTPGESYALQASADNYADGWLGGSEPDPSAAPVAAVADSLTDQDITLGALNTATVCVVDTSTPPKPVSTNVDLYGLYDDGQGDTWWEPVDTGMTGANGCYTFSLPQDQGYTAFTAGAEPDGVTHWSAYLPGSSQTQAAPDASSDGTFSQDGFSGTSVGTFTITVPTVNTATVCAQNTSGKPVSTTVDLYGWYDNGPDDNGWNPLDSEQTLANGCYTFQVPPDATTFTAGAEASGLAGAAYLGANPTVSSTTPSPTTPATDNTSAGTFTQTSQQNGVSLGTYYVTMPQVNEATVCVADLQGNKLDNAELDLYGWDADTQQWDWLTWTTTPSTGDPTGCGTFSLPPDTTVFTVQASMYDGIHDSAYLDNLANEPVKATGATGSGTRVQNVATGQTLDWGTITLPTMNTVNVCVVDTQNKPISDGVDSQGNPLTTWVDVYGWNTTTKTWDGDVAWGYTDPTTGCASNITLPAGYTVFSAGAESDGVHAPGYLDNLLNLPATNSGDGTRTQPASTGADLGTWTIVVGAGNQVTGTVVDQTGAAVPNAWVDLYAWDPVQKSWNYVYETQADPNGVYTLAGIPAGVTYTINAGSYDGKYNPAWLGGPDQPASGTTGTPGVMTSPSTITATPQQAGPIVLQQLVEVDGTVVLPDGTTPYGDYANLTIYAWQNGQWVVVDWETSDPTSNGAFTALVPENSQIAIQADPASGDTAYLTGWSGSQPVGPADNNGAGVIQVTATPGNAQQIDPIPLTDVSAPVSFTASGLVVDGTGAVVQGANVDVSSGQVQCGDPDCSWPSAWVTTTTDSTGYTVGIANGGAYTVRAQLPGTSDSGNVTAVGFLGNPDPSSCVDFTMAVNYCAPTLVWGDQKTLPDITLYADVTFDANGGTLDSDGDTGTDVYVGLNKTLASASAPTPTQPGYTFVNWNTQPDGSGTSYTSSSTIPGSMTLYAQWTPNTTMDTVTFNGNGGTVADSTGANPAATQTAQVPDGAALGTTLPLKAQMARAGYVFTGWDTKADGSGDLVTTATLASSGLTVYAQWVATGAPATVTFDTNCSTTATATNCAAVPAPVTIPAGTTIGTSWPTDPAYTGTGNGYTFGGWFPYADGSGTQVTADTVVSGNTTVYAKWTPVPLKPVMVTFVGNCGTPDNTQCQTAPSPATMPVAQNAAIGTLPAQPVYNVNYTFNGWNTAPDGSGTSVDATTKAGTTDMTVYAQWKPVTVTINFDPNGGSKLDIASESVPTGTTITAWPTAPTLAYNSFTGWNSVKSGGTSATVVDTGTTIKADMDGITLYAQWAPKSATVTFDGNGVTIPAPAASVTLAQGSAVGALPTPTRTGYTLTGWNTAANGTGTAVTKDTIVTSATMTVYAQWQKNGVTPPPPSGPTTQVTVTFNANGGNAKGTAVKTLAKGTALGTSIPTGVTRTGYTLTGWNTKANGTGTTYTSKTTVNASVTLYAQWKAVGSGSSSSKGKTTTGKTTTAGKAPTGKTSTGKTSGGSSQGGMSATGGSTVSTMTGEAGMAMSLLLVAAVLAAFRLRRRSTTTASLPKRAIR